jgi:hypothetical protein
MSLDTLKQLIDDSQLGYQESAGIDAAQCSNCDNSCQPSCTSGCYNGGK